MNKPFYLMNNGYYLNYEENCSSALKISNIICSEEKKHSWIFSGNKLQNNETKGYLTKNIMVGHLIYQTYYYKINMIMI